MNTRRQDFNPSCQLVCFSVLMRSLLPWELGQHLAESKYGSEKPMKNTFFGQILIDHSLFTSNVVQALWCPRQKHVKYLRSAGNFLQAASISCQFFASHCISCDVTARSEPTCPPKDKDVNFSIGIDTSWGNSVRTGSFQAWSCRVL